MIILPAIDLYGKKAVRLYKGDYEKMTVYSDSPLKVAYDFERSGAEYIHIVDLEGAKDGTTPNLSVVSEIAGATKMKIEVGGGIRSIEVIEKYLNSGADKVILGTAAVTDRTFLTEAVKRYGQAVAVGADVKDGFVAIRGWKEKSAFTLSEFMKDIEKVGVKNIICTDISKDGAMQGTNLSLYKELSEKYQMDITASGGISGIEDIEALKKMGIYGAIVGKAYYEGALDLARAIEVAKC